MSKIIHDLTNTLPWVGGIKEKCRFYIGHYGDTYVLPIRCFIGKTTINGSLYGRIYFKSPDPDHCVSITTLYSDDEVGAYEKFMRRLNDEGYCEMMHKYRSNVVVAPYGKKTSSYYEKLDLPVIRGVTIRSATGKIRDICTCIDNAKIITYIHTATLSNGKEAILKVFREHLAKMPAEWLAKRHIPEIYLE